jgi:hypothetical protein
LGFRQKGPGEIGAVEHRLEEVRAVEMGACQIRVAEICSPEIGAPKIGPRKIEPAQVEPSQTGPRQVRRQVVFRPPLIPRCGAAAEHRDVLNVWHRPPLSNLLAALSRYLRRDDQGEKPLPIQIAALHSILAVQF